MLEAVLWLVSIGRMLNDALGFYDSMSDKSGRRLNWVSYSKLVEQVLIFDLCCVLAYLSSDWLPNKEVNNFDSWEAAFLNRSISLRFWSSVLISIPWIWLAVEQWNKQFWHLRAPRGNKHVVKLTIPLSKICPSCVMPAAPGPSEVCSHVLNELCCTSFLSILCLVVRKWTFSLKDRTAISRWNWQAIYYRPWESTVVLFVFEYPSYLT